LLPGEVIERERERERIREDERGREKITKKSRATLP